MIQNAIDFADSKVWIILSWSESDIKITINDDGPGFPVQMISRIGDPFVSYRKSSSVRDKQIEYEGMGLGLFIAKTLLERTNAKLNFSNGASRSVDVLDNNGHLGAVVEISWTRSDIEKKKNNCSLIEQLNRYFYHVLYLLNCFELAIYLLQYQIMRNKQYYSYGHKYHYHSTLCLF